MHTPPLLEWANHFSDKIDLSRHNTILDLGCRRGQISAGLAKKYPQQQFIAIDNLDNEIEQAKVYRSPNLQFDIQDARRLPFSQEFDAIVSFSMLLWIKEKQAALRSMYAALKPGGKAYLQFFVRHGRPKNDRFLYQAANDLEWRSYFRGFEQDYYDISVSEFCRLLQDTGFIIHRLELIRYPTFFEHADQLHHFFKSWASQRKYLPKNKQDHFFRHVTMDYLDFYQYSSQDPFRFHEYELEVICERPDDHLFERGDQYQYDEITFSKREAQILKYYLNGKSAKEIALLVALSAKTVEFHLANIKEKCRCKKRSDLFRVANEKGFIGIMFDTQL